MCGQHAQTRAQKAKLDPFDMCHFISFLDFLLAAKTFKVMFGSRRSYSGFAEHRIIWLFVHEFLSRTMYSRRSLMAVSAAETYGKRIWTRSITRFYCLCIFRTAEMSSLNAITMQT